LIYLGESPVLVARASSGDKQNLASPSGWVTCTCILGSSREKKKNRKLPSRKIVGDIAQIITPNVALTGAVRLYHGALLGMMNGPPRSAWINDLQGYGLESGVNRASPGSPLVDAPKAVVPGLHLGYAYCRRQSGGMIGYAAFVQTKMASD
jgi:hypothetical protein